MCKWPHATGKGRNIVTGNDWLTDWNWKMQWNGHECGKRNEGNEILKATIRNIDYDRSNTTTALRHVTSWTCLKAVIKLAWHIPVTNVQWRTPDDGHRNCPKDVEFLDKNKFGKISASVGFIKKKVYWAVDQGSAHSDLCIVSSVQGMTPMYMTVYMHRKSLARCRFITTHYWIITQPMNVWKKTRVFHTCKDCKSFRTLCLLWCVFF